MIFSKECLKYIYLSHRSNICHQKAFIMHLCCFFVIFELDRPSSNSLLSLYWKKLGYSLKKKSLFVFYRTEWVIQVWNKQMSELMLRIWSVSLFGVESCLSRNYCPTSDLSVLLKISQINLRITDKRKIISLCGWQKQGLLGTVSTHFLSSIFAKGHLCHSGAQFQPQSPFIDFQMSFLKLRLKTFYWKGTNRPKFAFRRVTCYQKFNNLYSITIANIVKLQVRFCLTLHVCLFVFFALLEQRAWSILF